MRCIRPVDRYSIPCGQVMVVWIVYPACGHGTKTHCEGTGWVMQVVPVASAHVVRWAVPGKMGGRLCCSFCCGLCGPVGGWELFHSACIVAVCPSIHPSIHLFHQSIHLFIHYFCCSQTVTNLKLQALSSFHNILTYCNRYECS